MFLELKRKWRGGTYTGSNFKRTSNCNKCAEVNHPSSTSIVAATLRARSFFARWIIGHEWFSCIFERTIVIILHLFSDGQAFSFLLSIYLSLYMDEQAKEKSDKMFLWSKKTDWKGPEWDIIIEQQNVDDINLLSKGDQNTLFPELSNLNINHNNRAWRTASSNVSNVWCTFSSGICPFMLCKNVAGFIRNKKGLGVSTLSQSLKEQNINMLGMFFQKVLSRI